MDGNGHWEVCTAAQGAMEVWLAPSCFAKFSARERVSEPLCSWRSEDVPKKNIPSHQGFQHIAIEHGHRNSGFFPINSMVIFHSYVSLPEGNDLDDLEVPPCLETSISIKMSECWENSTPVLNLTCRAFSETPSPSQHVWTCLGDIDFGVSSKPVFPSKDKYLELTGDQQVVLIQVSNVAETV